MEEKWSMYEKRFILKNHFESVKFQILLYTFANDIHITKGELNLLTHISISGMEKSTMKEALTKRIFKSKYSLGNALVELTKKKLLLLDENNKKYINPKLELITNELLLGTIKVINFQAK